MEVIKNVRLFFETYINQTYGFISELAVFCNF